MKTTIVRAARTLRQFRTATITIVVFLVFAALLFCPPVERALGGILAWSQDGITILNYPAALRQEIVRRKGIYVKYAQIPTCLEQAIISVEDKRFLLHAGIDPIAIVRVLFEDIKNDHVDHGGSSITQQLAHAILRLPYRRLDTLNETVNELRMLRASFIIEHDFNKQTILELYLNAIYFGHGATGAEAAAEAYFETSLDRLDEGKCIYLAGLVQAPSFFGANPSGEPATTRYRHVITTMERNGYLTKSEGSTLKVEHLFSSQ